MLSGYLGAIAAALRPGRSTPDTGSSAIGEHGGAGMNQPIIASVGTMASQQRPKCPVGRRPS